MIYTSVEQYMMWSKADLFKDQEAMTAIMLTNDVADIKRLGRSVRNYDDHTWNEYRQIVVYRACYAKFSQNAELREKLLATKDAMLVECAVRDRICGAGLPLSDERYKNIKNWNGLNLLGYTLMAVRETLEQKY